MWYYSFLSFLYLFEILQYESYESTNDTNLWAAFINGFSFDVKCANPPGFIILDNWVFENFVLADEPFAKLYKFLKLVYQLIVISEEISFIIKTSNQIWLKDLNLP